MQSLHKLDSYPLQWNQEFACPLFLFQTLLNQNLIENVVYHLHGSGIAVINSVYSNLNIQQYSIHTTSHDNEDKVKHNKCILLVQSFDHVLLNQNQIHTSSIKLNVTILPN